MESLDPAALAQRLAAGEALRLIDVREADEFALCRIEGSELFPLSEWALWQEDLAESAETLVLICHHGVRSGRACGLLASRGKTGLINLRGGVDRWAVEVDPEMPRY